MPNPSLTSPTTLTPWALCLLFGGLATASLADAPKPAAATPTPAAPAVPGAPAPAAGPAPSGTHFIFLVRHGMYDRDDNANDRTGNPLNALGHEQAKLLGQRLAASGVELRAIAASDFTRARETAAEIGAILHLTPAPEPLIQECTPTAEHPEYTAHYSAEHIARCAAQLEGAWSKYFVATPGADTWDLLVSHGNVIRWLVAKATGNDVRKWYAADIGNASLTAVAVRPDGSLRLVLYSDVGHLPPALQTWAGKGPGWGKAAGPAVMMKK